MADKVKLRLTIVCDYDADPDHYRSSNGDPAAMARIDAVDYAADPELAIEQISHHGFTTTVVPVEVTP